MEYTNKSNQKGLDDLHWLLADDKGASWFYERVAREVLNFRVALAGGGTTNLATKVTWQANEFAQIKALINRNHALLTVLGSAVTALAESSNADTDEVKALISQKMEEATAVLKVELDELQAAAEEEIPEMEPLSLELPKAEPLDLVPVAQVNPAEVPDLDEESAPAEAPKVEPQTEGTAPNAAPVPNV